MAEKPQMIAIVGPTASGKSDLAVRLAKKFGGEVISADSRQVYKGLDIGTGKVTKKEMAGIPHYLLDVVSPKKQYSVAEFQRDANKAIADILKRGKLPIICGGTGFYVDALVYDSLLPDVPPNEALRKKLDRETTESLYEILKKIDPERAETIDAQNPRRLVRAIEIAQALGKVPERSFNSSFTPLFIGIKVPAEILKERIHVRLLKRMKGGMLAEAKTLHEKGLSWKRMEELGLEYRYLARYLRGAITKSEMLIQLESAIIQYAKRQHTWFKRNTNIHWVEYDSPAKAEKIVLNFIKKTSE